jgi:hypothetical protein
VRLIAVGGKLAYNFDIDGATIVSRALLSRRLGEIERNVLPPDDDSG